jgi:hypothetical protein
LKTGKEKVTLYFLKYELKKKSPAEKQGFRETKIVFKLVSPASAHIYKNILNKRGNGS